MSKIQGCTLQQLLDAADRSQTAERDRAIVHLLQYSNLTLQRLADLRWRDVVSVEGGIVFRYDSDSGTSIRADAGYALDVYRATLLTTERDDLVFGVDGGRRSIWAIVNRLSRRARGLRLSRRRGRPRRRRKMGRPPKGRAQHKSRRKANAAARRDRSTQQRGEQDDV